ncbi:Eukaryotic translation initiation factor 3 subunit A {ECO:0000255/HAMAP-Rule:MF_03000} Short=eIF3a {ECO:0000255/HAMAP-Rule:MF_03000}; AltName: Full=Eukaryotic translation initiation factor 3 110 kDa subunit homolog {ECO:0000255/HAMAP-Rule:MF_03000}; Short=eIF3 p110 {ECO:0000255/HAMAP-Rule:MF_03000}; AltName: Full=Translation initiation factor eIF3, p110 subunit homolog {ECO:0000255/HAMAP-Rule:MF_03000} [Serendipita indica DSM 11827]|nr:Eukaryotic translation initiation factor 3 subunit A {ECO:0000255/HAMAP-Rule:MF_03000} Short=eIF3a {ECO:0000255/HAMAP-Rule:MF_03000}; AltName: Full=Eukaryotic translation initiation factor 3 110 kDa subunit homolog {ECO:0000255/HAMAP-Rule:MF_03000}; Short=eIF3 p110 {ECO:0000255/HAMAP-Rule:MF_03000}; AltName: Full=Translation initiation factor eIF3, p110 subunit homolog {ECO:0000255/HAMAP-Rule:MF_03000} [Serendipita indica DSM 11827]
MPPFSKPETVLKQAEGLVSVGQTPAALQSLTEMFNSKRFRSTPVASLEPIMMRFIELCVELRKGRTAKEGLMQYKNITQNTSVQSIENVINAFIQLANAKVVDAQVKADKAIEVLDVDDLEASESPEDVLLGAVSGDQNKDRTDRALVTPWLKFLWESYRSALETLKNNARLEAIYQSIALQAFNFCLSHRRKVEFRRLCETLRLHLATVAKYSHQTHSVNLSDPDTLQRFLDTRFAQLNTSVELELWQEAFRSIEDIHNLLTMSKKPPKPSMMINYYEKLYKIFMTSGSILYHAAAWSKYFAILRTSGKQDEEMERVAGFVLISALAVPVMSDSGEDGEDTKGKHARLTTLLGLSKIPTRASLLSDAFARNVLKLSPRPLLDLYDLLEVQFDPLGLCDHATAILDRLSVSEEFTPYLPHLRRVILSRLLSQLSQVYSSLSISYLLDLVSPLNRHLSADGDRFDQENLEAFIMSAAKRGELFIRLNHSSGSILFVDDAFSIGSGSGSSKVQPSPGKLVRSRLSHLAECLHNVVRYIDDAPDTARGQLQAAHSAFKAEQQALQTRRSIVARRRELQAELVARRQNEERSQQAEMTLRAQEDAQRKKRAEALKEAQERAKAEMERKRKEENVKIVSSLLDRGVSIDADITALDTEQLVQLQVEHMDKERRELNERLRVIAKRMDHIERAFRKAEIPLLVDDYARQQAEDRAAFEASRQGTIDSARAMHQEKIDTKRRLSRILPDYRAYMQSLGQDRRDDYNRRFNTATSKILEEKTRRRNEILKQREREAEQRAEEERIRREKEEAEARAREEREAEERRRREAEDAARLAAETKQREEEERVKQLRKQREAERAEAAEVARRQREREEEAERRRQARSSGTGPASGGAGGGDVWRRSQRPAEGSPGTRPSQQPQSRYVPPGARGSEGGSSVGRPGGGGWRERERLREESGRPGTPGRQSPAPQDDDGFQQVKPRPSTGAYRPPGARNR